MGRPAPSTGSRGEDVATLGRALELDLLANVVLYGPLTGDMVFKPFA